MSDDRVQTNPEIKQAALDLEGKTLDEVKGIVMAIDSRGEKTADRMGMLEEIIGFPSKPGTFPGDPDVPGKGIAGAVERLARTEVARAKSHASIAARTGG